MIKEIHELMGKLENLNRYIEQCDVPTQKDAMKTLLGEIIHTYSPEIPQMIDGLDMYGYGDVNNIDYVGDLRLVKAKLINYRDNLEEEEIKASREIEKLRLQQSILNINNSSNNTNTNTATASNQVAFTIDQAVKNINSLPENILSSEEKEILEDKLSAIELSLNKKDKESLIDKIGKTVRYISDKGIEVGIAILPYLGEIAKHIPTLG